MWSAFKLAEKAKRISTINKPLIFFFWRIVFIHFSSEEDASFEPFAHNLPILIALTHKDNVTKDSFFLKVQTRGKWQLISLSQGALRTG